MWCANCQADVAAEVAADNRRIRCASCGTTIDAARPAWTSEKTREARELLQRWSSSRLFDEPATAAAPTARASADDEEARLLREPRETIAAVKPSLRVDAPHAVSLARAAEPSPANTPPATQVPAASARYDAPQPAAPAPHFDVQSAILQDEPRRGSWMSGCGQLLAYLGVLGLTVGTTLVLWGHFGGPERAAYGPTGWLISTVGQMLLLLGIVTLISGGMEQTADEVRRRIETVNARLDRLERAAQHSAAAQAADRAPGMARAV